VTKVHVEVAKLAKEGFEFIMIGHKGHPEVEGTMGQLSEGIYLVEEAEDVAHVQAARQQAGGGDADHAERGRRGGHPGRGEALFSARARTQEAGHLLRHAEPAGRGQADGAGRWTWSSWWAAPPAATATACVNWPSGWARRPTWSKVPTTCSRAWFEGRRRVGLTAGASAPDVLVQAVINRLREFGATSIRKMHGVVENVHFPLPRGLGDRSMSEVQSSRS
jgi:4-hydroxy-3-methylbut-2-enyl diphosphate reductase